MFVHWSPHIQTIEPSYLFDILSPLLQRHMEPGSQLSVEFGDIDKLIKRRNHLLNKKQRIKLRLELLLDRKRGVALDGTLQLCWSENGRVLALQVRDTLSIYCNKHGRWISYDKAFLPSDEAKVVQLFDVGTYLIRSGHLLFLKTDVQEYQVAAASFRVFPQLGLLLTLNQTHINVLSLRGLHSTFSCSFLEVESFGLVDKTLLWIRKRLQDSLILVNIVTADEFVLKEGAKGLEEILGVKRLDEHHFWILFRQTLDTRIRIGWRVANHTKILRESMASCSFSIFSFNETILVGVDPESANMLVLTLPFFNVRDKIAMDEDPMQIFLPARATRPVAIQTISGIKMLF